MGFTTLRLVPEGLELLDQRLLPEQERMLLLRSGEDVARAIEQMAVRGAPAIGLTAAMGIAVELRAAVEAKGEGAELEPVLEAVCARLRRTRPTAVNLGWAIDRVSEAVHGWLAEGVSPDRVCEATELLARQMLDEDIAICRAIGDAGAPLVPDDARVLTHCNAGGLATGGYGTALGVVRSAAREGRIREVLASETRPFLQGARLTAWELQHDSIPVRVLTDSMSGALMARGEIDIVVVGADRIAANGDVANKIGTYVHAVLAARHGIPFYVAAPLSTIDLATKDGAAIPIEERSASEVLEIAGRRIAPKGVDAIHLAFDVTPAELITGIITEKGVARAPYTSSLAALFEG